MTTEEYKNLPVVKYLNYIRIKNKYMNNITSLILLSTSKWPVIHNVDDEDNNKVNNEPLQTDNFKIIDISDNSIIINSHGNWQNPHNVNIQFKYDKLFVKGFVEDLEVKESIPDNILYEIFGFATISGNTQSIGGF